MTHLHALWAGEGRVGRRGVWDLPLRRYWVPGVQCSNPVGTSRGSERLYYVWAHFKKDLVYFDGGFSICSWCCYIPNQVQSKDWNAWSPNLSVPKVCRTFESLRAHYIHEYHSSIKEEESYCSYSRI